MSTAATSSFMEVPMVLSKHEEKIEQARKELWKIRHKIGSYGLNHDEVEAIERGDTDACKKLDKSLLARYWEGHRLARHETAGVAKILCNRLRTAKVKLDELLAE